MEQPRRATEESATPVPVLRHVYQTRYASLQAYAGPGIGDFLRGCMRVWELCEEHGMRMEVCWCNHPVGEWLEPPACGDCAKPEDPASVPFFQHTQDDLLVRAVLAAKTRGHGALATNCFPRKGPPGDACKTFLRGRLRPNAALADALRRAVTDYAAAGDDPERPSPPPPPPPYAVAHVRVGDAQLLRQGAVPDELVRRIGTELRARLPHGTTAYVVSDSGAMRERLRAEFGFRVAAGAAGSRPSSSASGVTPLLAPCHLGSSDNPDPEVVRDTLVEFLLMSRAERIVQSSAYPWGSGFSHSCAALYDVPIERLTPIDSLWWLDRAWYLQRNPDVAAVRQDPCYHYRTWGHREMRAPNRFLNPTWFRVAYALPADVDPGQHYAAHWHRAPLDPCAGFGAAYRAALEGVPPPPGVSPLQHVLADPVLAAAVEARMQTRADGDGAAAAAASSPSPAPVAAASENAGTSSAPPAPQPQAPSPPPPPPPAPSLDPRILAVRAAGGVEYGFATYGSIEVMFPAPGVRCTVGRYCSIAGGVQAMLAGNHRVDWITTYPFSAFRNPSWPTAPAGAPIAAAKGNIVIGHDVWIAKGVLLLSGITVGHGAVIGAHAVVTRDVPPYAVAAGNPARVVRRRFEPQQIEGLLRVRWWDWPVERVGANIYLLQSGDVDGFLRAHLDSENR